MPYATNDGVRIYYEREGDGPPIVLHHGFSLSIADWREWGIVDALRGEYELVLMDPRGHGASDKPHDPAAYAMATRVADVVAVMDDAGIERPVFFGYSMGGHVGYAAAEHAPSRFRAFIIGGAQPGSPAVEHLLRGAEALRRGGMAGYVEALGPIPVEMRRRLLANDAEVLAASRIGTSRAPSYEDAVARLRVPMLVFAGGNDQPIHDQAQRAASGNPHVRFVSLPGFGHVNVASAAVVPHLRTFLAEVYGPASTPA